MPYDPIQGQGQGYGASEVPKIALFYRSRGVDRQSRTGLIFHPCILLLLLLIKTDKSTFTFKLFFKNLKALKSKKKIVLGIQFLVNKLQIVAK